MVAYPSCKFLEVEGLQTLNKFFNVKRQDLDLEEERFEKRLWSLFKKLDSNDDGCLNLRSFIDLLRMLGYDEVSAFDAAMLFRQLDTERNGRIDFLEFRLLLRQNSEILNRLETAHNNDGLARARTNFGDLQTRLNDYMDDMLSSRGINTERSETTNAEPQDLVAMMEAEHETIQACLQSLLQYSSKLGNKTIGRMHALTERMSKVDLLEGLDQGLTGQWKEASMYSNTLLGTDNDHNPHLSLDEPRTTHALAAGLPRTESMELSEQDHETPAGERFIELANQNSPVAALTASPRGEDKLGSFSSGTGSDLISDNSTQQGRV